MSLRGGNSRDEYREPPPFDPELDRPTPEYLERYFWGIAHLDAESWRYYLPILIRHTLHNIENARSMAVDAFLASLRPPDREPPRLESLSVEERRAHYIEAPMRPDSALLTDAFSSLRCACGAARR